MPKSKFSSRSTGFIDSRDVPTKTSTTKQNKSLFPTTPIKFGDMETLLLLMNNDPEALYKIMMLYASSPIARRSVGQIYEHGYMNEIKVPKRAVNVNTETMKIKLKGCGIGMSIK